MFIGRYYHNLESKGRLAIPSSFRRQLGSKPIVTRGLDGCLFLLPPATWEKLTLDLRGRPLTNQDAREFIRLIAHDAFAVVFDRQGRATIPLALRQSSGITKSVVIAGSLDWVEIWDQVRYHQHLEQNSKKAEVIAEKLSSTKYGE